VSTTTTPATPTAAEAELAVQARQAPVPVRSQGYWAGVWKRLRRDPVTIGCALVLLAMLLAIVFAPLIAPHDPYQGSMIRRLRAIGTPNYVLGTDELGRDMLTRLLYGGRLSWFMGIVPVALAFVVGTVLGVLAGFAGGKVNMAIMRVTDVFYAFPSVLLAVAISGALGAGIVNAILALTLVFVPPIIRVAESVTTGVRNLDFVDAARASGAGAFTVVRVHVLGNVLGPIFVYATSLISVCMILASGLSFLGLGTKPPEPEWGLMLNTLRTAIYVQPWVAVLPGACIFVTSICFNLLSDGLRQAMDVKG
jgi:peptide/nickel transport system permease protein